jgi:DNA-binding transcriptional ArsR family regulator
VERNKLIDELTISSALAHLTRLEILDLLRNKNFGFNELKDELNLNPNTLSFHIKTLREADLIDDNEDGYTLTELGRKTFEDLVQRARERLESSDHTKTVSNRVHPTDEVGQTVLALEYVNPDSPQVDAKLEEDKYLTREGESDSQNNSYLDRYI